MIILALLLMVVHTLSCDDPDMFFNVSSTNDFPKLGKELDRKYVFDEIGATGKVLRVTDGAVAFGAAKVSALLERNLASVGWGIMTNNTYCYDLSILEHLCKTSNLSRLRRAADPVTDYYTTGTNRTITTNATRRITEETLVNHALGTGNTSSEFFKKETSLETCLRNVFMSKLLNNNGLSNDPRTFGLEDLTNVMKIYITTNHVSKIWMKPMLYHSVSNYPWREIPCSSCYGLIDKYTDLIDYEGHNIEPWLDAARYDRPPTQTVDFISFMADYVNTNDFIRPHPLDANQGRRFNYGRSQAESWLIGLHDTVINEVSPNGYIPVDHMSSNVTRSYTLSNSNVRASWSDERRGWVIDISAKDISEGSMQVNVYTNSTSEVFARMIEEGVENRCVDSQATIQISMVLSVGVDSLILSILGSEDPLGQYLGIYWDTESGLMECKFLTSDVFVSCTHEGFKIDFSRITLDDFFDYDLSRAAVSMSLRPTGHGNFIGIYDQLEDAGFVKRNDLFYFFGAKRETEVEITGGFLTTNFAKMAIYQSTGFSQGKYFGYYDMCRNDIRNVLIDDTDIDVFDGSSKIKYSHYIIKELVDSMTFTFPSPGIAGYISGLWSYQNGVLSRDGVAITSDRFTFSLPLSSSAAGERKYYPNDKWECELVGFDKPIYRFRNLRPDFND